MPVSLEFLRGVLGVLCVLFAHMAGRSAIAVRKRQQKVSRVYAWIFRAAVCAFGVAFRHPVDAIDMGVWILSAAAFAVGWWDASREKKTEDLTGRIFPE
ncbi:MAG TPA: hypothetical protein VKT49_22570 [Bryobacteraceae bacterium]|nr:hypothetical protein [Bryobacteraceae bacterium]